MEMGKLLDAIRKEQAKEDRNVTEQSKEWIEHFGVDFGSMSEEELATVVRKHEERMGREGT
jgi:hypothetical protein